MEEADRADDFFDTLRRIEFQAALLADNPNYDLDSEKSLNIIEEKSTDLMSAIIIYFNSSLIYFRKNFFRMFLCIFGLTLDREPHEFSCGRPSALRRRKAKIRYCDP